VETHRRVLEFVRDESEANKAQRIRYIGLLGQVGRPDAALVLLDVAETSRWHSVRRAALGAAARFEAPEVGRRIVGMYPKLPTDQGVRPAAVATLLTRPAWTAQLLRGVKSGIVPKSDVAPEQLAAVRKSEDRDVLQVVAEVFGPERRPSSAEKMQEFERVKRVVLASPGNADAGKVLFTARCATCHTLFGEGGKVGPDLTGYERVNVDNMLINVVDPSAYIREEFQTFGVRTKSGQTLVGIITDRGPNQITLADSTGRATVVAKADIKSEKALPTSTMPEGLLDGLTDAQLRDLFGYLGSSKR
jgi:putative heme-binding domain-containing protein